MRIGAMAAFATLIVGLSLFSLVPASASEGFGFSLHIPGETPLYNGQEQPVMIAGVWHDLSLTLESPVQDLLTVEASSLATQAENMSSHYVWERDEGSSTWSDLLYGFFIKSEYSSSTGDEILFRLGIDAAAVSGTWRILITQDGATVGDQLIEVRTPRVGYGMSSADFNLRWEPFKAAELSSEDRGQYLRVINNGNVPLRLSVTFDKLQSRLSLVNPSDLVHIHSETKYFLRADMDPRPPQIIKVKGTARVEASGLIPSPGATQMVPALESDFDLTVVIGRSGYTVQALGNVFFQTIETLRADYGSVVTWQVYLTGDEDVSLDVDVVGAQLIGVWLGDNPLTLPATLSPSPQAELPLSLQVRTNVPSTLAEVIFTLHLLDSGEVQTYSTVIVVGAKPSTPSLGPSLLWLFASVISASVLALVSYNHLRLEPRSTSRRSSRKGSTKGKRRAGSKAGKKDRRKAKNRGVKKNRAKGKSNKRGNQRGGKVSKKDDGR